MKSTLVATVSVLFGLFVVGCGGSALGRNSNMSIHLQRTDGTQVMTQYELYVTKNSEQLDVLDSENFASTSNQPSWIDGYSATRTSTELVLNFRTRGGQSTYLVYVKVPNTSSQFETLRFRVDVDGTTGADQDFDLNINDTSQLPNVGIERNSANY